MTKCFLFHDDLPLKVGVVYIVFPRLRMEIIFAEVRANLSRSRVWIPASAHRVLKRWAIRSVRQRRLKSIDCEFFLRDNDGGKDLSAYQEIARETDFGFLVCFGESIHIRMDGWLEAVVNARLKHGPGMYGYFSSHMVRAHLNTTGFGIDANYLREFRIVTNDAERYNAEHGPGCWWQQIYKGGGKAMLVTSQNVYPPGKWRIGDGIMHRGRQENCLVWSHHCENWVNASPATQSLWQSQSDQPFHL